MECRLSITLDPISHSGEEQREKRERVLADVIVFMTCPLIGPCLDREGDKLIQQGTLSGGD